MGRNTGLPDELRRYRVTGADSDRQHWPDDAGCTILHVDMDAFFAAVELRTRPELAASPVIVAGQGPRSVVLSANYPARRYGVRSAMPVATARRLCPQAVYLPPTRGLYGEISQAVLRMFRDVTPVVEPLSLDEAFLDVAGSLRRLRSTPARLGAEIRASVAAEHGITCSVGVAPVKFVAKLASGMAKPDGMVVVPQADLHSFLRPLPASALAGVGERTNAALERSGLRTVADIAATPVNRLSRIVGDAAGKHLHALANGHDERPVIADAPDKSLGAEHTFDTDQRDRDVLTRELLGLAERVAAGLRSKAVLARTVTIKLRFSGFVTITRSRSLAVPTDVAREIYATALTLFDHAYQGEQHIRLVGVRVDGLTPAAAGQQLFLADDRSRWRDAEVAADTARTKFGTSAVHPASLIRLRATSNDSAPESP